MEVFFDIYSGALSLFADPLILVMIVVGMVYGVIVGALPGVGATLGFGLILPFTFFVDPIYSVAFLTSIAVGNQYGNSLPAS